ncbi:hypothetical protein [Gottfriedia acidiceleris]|uniref:hypothetical protein n=1 Tax=Gottfriedia acidiceleris TaxID=371036 RepID=UPI00101DED13|nr:hypothetical protein [Gottfriedia acidiceleris]
MSMERLKNYLKENGEQYYSELSGRNCGVCNEEVSIYERQIGKQEFNGDITPYHMKCEYEARKLVPCDECGIHRKFCSECKE